MNIITMCYIIYMNYLKCICYSRLINKWLNIKIMYVLVDCRWFFLLNILYFCKYQLNQPSKWQINYMNRFSGLKHIVLAQRAEQDGGLVMASKPHCWRRCIITLHQIWGNLCHSLNFLCTQQSFWILKMPSGWQVAIHLEFGLWYGIFQ